MRSQFHYGSIKTEFSEGVFSFQELSQFHYGSIKTNLIDSKIVESFEVSIPLWFD
mgnify:CR=1 FL=1